MMEKEIDINKRLKSPDLNQLKLKIQAIMSETLRCNNQQKSNDNRIIRVLIQIKSEKTSKFGNRIEKIIQKNNFFLTINNIPFIINFSLYIIFFTPRKKEDIS